MSNLSKLFERQARWQESLRHLPWPEKVRMVARLRASVIALRSLRPAAPTNSRKERPR